MAHDVRTTQFEERPVKRLFLVLGHGVLTPAVQSRKPSDYFTAAAGPSPMPDKPGVMITVGERGSSVHLAQFIDERALSLPHEMLSYIQETRAPPTIGAVKKMLRKMRTQFFDETPKFTVRTPTSMLESTVMWARGDRIIYGGAWMINLENPTAIENVAHHFGLTERPIEELDARESDEEVNGIFEEALIKSVGQLQKDHSSHPGDEKIGRILTDLRLHGQMCLGELKYATGPDRHITLKEFLENGKHFLTKDDIMIVVMCRNYAGYADHLQDTKSPRNAKNEGMVNDFGGGRLKKRKGTKTKKKHKNRIILKKKTKIIKQVKELII